MRGHPIETQTILDFCKMGSLRGIDPDPFLPPSGMTTNPMTLRTVLGALRTPATAPAGKPPTAPASKPTRCSRASPHRPPRTSPHDVREQAHTDPREQA